MITEIVMTQHNEGVGGASYPQHRKYLRWEKDLVQNNDFSYEHRKFKVPSGHLVEKSNRMLDDLELRREGRADAIYLGRIIV